MRKTAPLLALLLFQVALSCRAQEPVAPIAPPVAMASSGLARTQPGHIAVPVPSEPPDLLEWPLWPRALAPGPPEGPVDAYVLPGPMTRFARKDPALSRACGQGRFVQKVPDLLTARVADPKAAKAFGWTRLPKPPPDHGPRAFDVVFPGGTNLLDLDGVADRSTVYFFRNQGFANCEVWTAPGATLTAYRRPAAAPAKAPGP